VYATSYGTTAALLGAALEPDIGAVVVDSAPAAQLDVIDGEIQLRGGPPSVFTPGISFVGARLYGLDLNAIAPERAVAQIAPRPILFIHGTADTRVPAEQTLRLVRAAQNPADEVWIVPGAGHAESFDLYPADYAARVTGFFNRSLRGHAED
jgi:fermentation-respiration switch protein FrsA (DUF1100 family)